MEDLINRGWTFVVTADLINDQRDSKRGVLCTSVKLSRHLSEERTWELAQLRKLAAARGERFTVFDDDGEPYYQGVYLDPGDRGTGFEPLDWARGSGCTFIRLNGVRL